MNHSIVRRILAAMSVLCLFAAQAVAEMEYWIGYKENKGKGYALKRGFEYIGNNLAEEVDYIVTADSDGQHKVTDIKKCIDALEQVLAVLQSA